MQQREENRLLRGRVKFLSYAVLVALLILSFGFWNHQMVYSSYYADKAEANRVREIPLIAPRGRIYDRNHKLIADNRPSYNIVLIRENSPHAIEETIGMLSSGINVSVQDLRD